jgi:hypothetical protein
MNKFLLFFKSGLPQLLGILSFIWIINLVGNEALSLSLPAYQAGLSFSSIFFLGVAYLNKRANILLRDYFFILVVGAFLFYVISYGFGFPNETEFSSLLIFLTLSLLGYIQFFVLGNFGAMGLLNANIIISILAPVILAMNLLSLWMLIVFIFISLIFYSNKFSSSLIEKTKFEPVFFRSIFVQLPFLAFPFFDFLLISFAGVDYYVEFSLFFKIANGAIVFLFSYFQLSVLNGDFKYIRYLSWHFYFIIFFAFLLSFMFLDWLIIPVQCILISIAINVSSLNIRSSLKMGHIGDVDIFISLFMIFIYYLFLIYGSSLSFSMHSFTFILFMIFIIVGLRSFYILKRVDFR